MAEHVEARSLAELNYLAANPPQYPTNPAEKKQDPVVLYISRVPGTRGKFWFTCIQETLATTTLIPEQI